MLVKLLLVNANGHSARLSGASFLKNHISSLIYRRLVPRLTPKTSVSRYGCCFFIVECHDHILLNDVFGLFI